MAERVKSRRHGEGAEPHGGRRRVSRTRSAAHARQGPFAAGQAGLQPFHLDATSEIQEVKVLGEWAYLWTKLSVVVTPKKGGAPVKRAGHTLSILQKQAGAWVIVRDANLLAVVPQ